MRIAVDVSAMLDHHGGFRTYLEKLLAAVSALDAKDEFLLYVARWAAFPAPEKCLPALGANFRPHFRRFPYRLLLGLEHRFGIPVQEPWLLPKLDLFHGACQVLPNPPRAPAVLTAHHFSDLRFHPGAWERFYYGRVYENSIRRADRIITVSDYTKGFLIERFGLAPEKVRTIYHGVFDPKPVVAPADIADLRKRYGLPERFAVCVSRINPGKNTVRLVKAFRRVAERDQEVGLVLVGWANPDYLVEVRRAVAEAGLEGRVVLTGPVPDADVPRFFAASALFVFPSTSEGFGIPLIEAMAMGVPVVAARATAIPEVVGNAGLLCDPEDEDDIAQAMLCVLEGPSVRAGLREKGLTRARGFTWEKAARETLEVYRSVA